MKTPELLALAVGALILSSVVIAPLTYRVAKANLEQGSSKAARMAGGYALKQYSRVLIVTALLWATTLLIDL